VKAGVTDGTERAEAARGAVNGTRPRSAAREAEASETKTETDQRWRRRRGEQSWRPKSSASRKKESCRTLVAQRCAPAQEIGAKRPHEGRARSAMAVGLCRASTLGQRWVRELKKARRPTGSPSRCFTVWCRWVNQARPALPLEAGKSVRREEKGFGVSSRLENSVTVGR
jgi:hypothetical protein